MYQREQQPPPQQQQQYQAPQQQQWHTPMRLALVDSLRSEHRIDAAIAVLLPLCQQLPSPNCYQQLAQLHAHDQQMALAFFYQAKSLAQVLNFKPAQRQISQGLAQQPISPATRQRLQQLQQNLRQQQQSWLALQ